MTDLLTSGELQQRIEHLLQPTYARRYRIMMHAIETHLVPLGAELPQTDRRTAGGYFIWVSLPESLDAELVAKRAREDENVIVAPGSLFEVPGDSESHKFPHDIRLCFAWVDEDKLTEGIERLGTVLQGMLSSGNDHSLTRGSGDDVSGVEKTSEQHW